MRKGNAAAALIVLLITALAGCTAYEGGKIVDGTNLEIGLSVPGTDGTMTINALAYTGGLKVCGNDRTRIVVSNEVVETNSYFGLIKTQRHSKMSSVIKPVDYVYIFTNGVPDGADMPRAIRMTPRGRTR